MERTVVERERRALAVAFERLVLGERGFTPLDIRRRQRAERAGDFAESKIRELTLLERFQECGEVESVG
jgi:hypothetical protein